MGDLQAYYVGRAKTLLKNEHSKNAFYNEKREKKTGCVLRFIFKRIGFMNWIEYRIDSDYKTVAQRKRFYAPLDMVDLNALSAALNNLNSDIK